MDWLSLCMPLTKASESCRLVAYADPATGAAPWTIGWGATGVGITKGVVWTQQQADDRLLADVTRAGQYVDQYVKIPLTPQQKAALTDFVFNVGPGNFSQSTMLRKLNSSDYAGAASEFPRWNLAAGRVMAGLVTRRRREQSLFLTGAWN